MKYQETDLATSSVNKVVPISLMVMSSNRLSSNRTFISSYFRKQKEVYSQANTKSNLLRNICSFRYSKKRQLRTLQVEQL